MSNEALVEAARKYSDKVAAHGKAAAKFDALREQLKRVGAETSRTLEEMELAQNELVKAGRNV